MFVADLYRSHDDKAPSKVHKKKKKPAVDDKFTV